MEEKRQKYAQNLEKVKQAILRISDRNSNDNAEQLEQLESLKIDLERALQYHQDYQNVAQEQVTEIKIKRLRSGDEGRLCYAYIEEQEQWKMGQIMSVDTITQTANVELLELKEDRNLPATYIQLLEALDASDIKPNLVVEVFNKSRWTWDQAKVITWSENLCKFVYMGKVSEYTFPIDHIRIPPEQSTEKEFKIPGHLKILPNDSNATRRKKKSRIRALKHQDRQEKAQEEAQSLISNWTDFQSNLKGIKRGKTSDQKPSKKIKFV